MTRQARICDLAGAPYMLQFRSAHDVTRSRASKSSL
jgi:hypothetical protein